MNVTCSKYKDECCPHRALRERLQRSLRDSPVVALVGPRQCGKTTLAREIARGRPGAYFDLEELIGLAGERNAWYWRTQAGAELDLLLMLRGRRIGVEVKYADAPSMTRSMHASIESLKLDRLYIIYPGSEPYALRPGVEVLPLPLARERLIAARDRRSPRRPPHEP